MQSPCRAEQGFAGDGEQRPLRSRSSPRLKPGVDREREAPHGGVRFSLSSPDTLYRASFFRSLSHPGWCERQAPPLHAGSLHLGSALLHLILRKETMGSPKFPSHPFTRMPRSQTPVVSRPLALARTGLLPSGSSIPSALGPVARPYPAVHHYTVFGVQ